ncbi:MAG: helicase-exonuclease AddAB subunit AddB [Thermoanaerobacteraceae bacterium]|nr:helicase-exonuclease AddAB subunit AddB [Thermoanaerobacteraceae bacterium]
MSLHFILGRAGTGKTRYCLEAIRRELLAAPDGPALILLVPEQATFQMEKALVTAPGLKGSIRAQVLSFRRLAWRVAQEVGGAVRPYIGDLARHMLLRRLLEHHAGRLQILGRAAWRQPGFLAEVASTLREFKHYRLTPELVRQAAAQVASSDPSGTLAAKLRDLALLWEEMEKALAPRFQDPEDTLEQLAANLLRSRELREAEIWVDGFTGFTPQEYAVLEGLLKIGRRVHVTLCLDRPGPVAFPGVDPFYPARETRDKLKDLARRLGMTVEPPTVLDGEPPPRFSAAPALAYIERNFFRPGAPSFAGETASVRLLAASDRRAEVEGVAREIVHLCRTRGYRWRDVAVMVRDLDLYRDLLVNVFTDYAIPFFLDAKRPLLHHPAVELLRAAVETVDRDWAYEPLFRLLKTDLAPLSREEVDVLENYVLAHGIRGERWLDGRPWTYRLRYTLDEDWEPGPGDEEDLERINHLRERVVAFLGPFHRALRSSRNVRETTLALYNLLLRLDVPGRLEAWRTRAMEEGRLDEAQEHAQIWEAVVEVLEQLVEILGDETLTLREYAQILAAGLEGRRLSLVPQGLDQVLIASLDRSRHPEVRAAFLLGVNEGVFPARPPAGGFLKDAERERLKEKGIDLAPYGERLLLEEQHLIYLALTRSRELLTLSYALADEEGRALRPSQVINRLKALLPGVEETTLGPEPSPAGDSLSYIARPGPALSFLAGQLRRFKDGEEIDPAWFDVYNWAREHPEYRPRLAKILDGLFYTNREEPLSPEISRALYGDTVKSSVSRLESFQACPFSHFLGHGLKLKERRRYKLVAPDLGRFFHAALKKLAAAVMEGEVDWGSLDPDYCRDLGRRIAEELAPQLQNEILLSTARYRYLTRKLRQTVEQAAGVLTEQARHSAFRPAGLELAFGRGESLPPLEIPLAGGRVLEISGRIDRVDVAPGPEGLWVRVVDYKSGPADLKLPDLYWGLKLQLFTYLEVLLTFGPGLFGRPCLPAGVLYFPVVNPLVRTPGPAAGAPEEELLKKFRMKGFVVAHLPALKLMDDHLPEPSPFLPVSVRRDGTLDARSAALTADQIQSLRRHLRRLLQEIGERIARGEVDIAPYRRRGTSPCRYCPYRPVCGFDPLLPGGGYRFLPDPDAREIWERLLQE